MRYQPTLKVLSDDQVYRIHQAALAMLMNPGVLVKSAEARKLLAQAGSHRRGVHAEGSFVVHGLRTRSEE